MHRGKCHGIVEAEAGPPSVKGSKGQAGSFQDSPQGQHGVRKSGTRE